MTASLVAPDPIGAAALSDGKSFALLRDTGGTITQIALSIIPETLKQDLKRRNAYENLLKVLLVSDASLLVVTAETLEDDVGAWLRGLAPLAAPGKYTIVPVPDAIFARSHVWPRDAMLCATGSQRFLQPNVSIHGDLSKWLTEKFGITPMPLDIWLDGGDSLAIDDDHWIVGAGAVQNMLAHHVAPDWTSAVRMYAAAIGCMPVIAGIPLDNMSLGTQWRHARSRAHRNAVKLDPSRPIAAHFASVFAATAEVLRNALNTGAMETDWDHIDMVVSVTGVVGASGKPKILVADARGKGCPPGKDAVDRGVVAEKADNLDRLASVLATDFEVVRNPAPCVNQTVLGCNNTIVQRPDTVWLPVFSDATLELEEADAENYRIWHEVLGFTNVVKVPGWSAFVDAQGCIRCATLPLARAS